MPVDRGLHACCKERAGLEYLLVCSVSLWKCVKDAKGAPRTVVNMRDTVQCQVYNCVYAVARSGTALDRIDLRLVKLNRR